jgi:hypothetical protein
MPRILPLVLLAVLSGQGCASGSRRSPQEAAVVLEVDNQASLDMTIYVIRSGSSRERLGLATAHRISWFRIPDRLIFGPTPLRFQADPIGAGAMPVTEDITVSPGDTVVFRIPPG